MTARRKKAIGTGVNAEAMVVSRELVVDRTLALTPDIKQFELVARDRSPLLEFQPGAHIRIATGAGVTRAYSLVSLPGVHDRYVIAVLREQDGRGSRWMHDDVHEGSLLRVEGPRNAFPLASDKCFYALLAGGIGITPLIGMCHALKARKAPFILHYCTRSPEKTAFYEEIARWFGPRVRFHHDGGDPTRGLRFGEVLEAHDGGHHAYICGPGGFIGAAREVARLRGYPSSHVHFELFSSETGGFGNAKVAASPAGDGALANSAFELKLARSGLNLTVPFGKSILEVLEESGIETVHVCREGWCGTCVQDLLEGRVDHRDDCLDEVDRDGKIITCCSRAAPGCSTLVIDL